MTTSPVTSPVTSPAASTDDDATDPIGPANTPHPILAQLWYPTTGVGANCPTALDESPAAAAAEEQQLGIPAGSFAAIRTPAKLNAPVAASPQGFPVVVYENELLGELSDNTAIALQLASEGYVVVAVGTTYEAPALTLPDGTVIAASARARQLISAGLSDPLLGWTPAAHGSPRRRRTRSLGRWRSSPRGAQDRPEVRAAVNLDGSTVENNASHGLAKPFLFLAVDGHTEASDSLWSSFLTNSRNGTLVQIGGIQHPGLTDLASDGWIDALGLPKDHYGDPAPGTEAAIIQGVAAFFDQTLRDQDTPGFQRLHASSPAIVTSVTPVP